MRRKITGITLVSILLILAGKAVVAAEEISALEVERFLLVEMEFSPTGAMRMWAAIEPAITDNRLQAALVLFFLERLDRVSGPIAIKEKIGLVITTALEDDLPVVLLIDEIHEGLARGIRLQLILRVITQQRKIISGVRDLLEARRIFITNTREEEGEVIFLPRERFDLVVMHIADALGIYLAAEGDPRHAAALYATAAERLVRLSEIEIIPTAIVELVLRRIDGEALSEIVVDVLDIDQD